MVGTGTSVCFRNYSIDETKIPFLKDDADRQTRLSSRGGWALGNFGGLRYFFPRVRRSQRTQGGVTSRKPPSPRNFSRAEIILREMGNDGGNSRAHAVYRRSSGVSQEDRKAAY